MLKEEKTYQEKDAKVFNGVANFDNDFIIFSSFNRYHGFWDSKT